MLITDQGDAALAEMASLVIDVQRGGNRHVALMGGPFAALEAIALGLAVADPAAATAALNRLRATLDPASRQEPDVPGPILHQKDCLARHLPSAQLLRHVQQVPPVRLNADLRLQRPVGHQSDQDRQVRREPVLRL